MLIIYAVSDSIAETSEQVANSVASQFKEDIVVKRIPHIKTYEDVNNFINNIPENENVMIVSTIILLDVREMLMERCAEKNISIVNVLGPCISMASRILGKVPTYRPGAIRDIDENYYKKIEAMEFAIKFDDSKDYTGLKYADIVLIGLSRTSKTPLSIYLSNKGIKVLNIPLMPEIPVPQELYNLDRKKIIGLTIDPLRLIDIRRHRLDRFNSYTSNIEYANDQRILDEFEYADKVMRKLKCKVIDVTNRAIEDTALIILQSMGYKHLE